MPKPSPYARKVLSEILLSAKFGPSDLISLLVSQGEPDHIAYSIEKTGALAKAIPAAVQTLWEHDLIEKHRKALERNVPGENGARFQELSYALKPQTAPDKLVPVDVLTRMKLAAKKGHLHDDAPLARLIKELPSEVITRAPEEDSNDKKVDALFDGANWQRVGPGDQVLLEILLDESIRQVEQGEARDELCALREGLRARLRGTVPVSVSGVKETLLLFGINADATEFHLRMGDALRRICLVRIADTDKGTGFLVGEDLILTNYHVLADLLKGAVQPQQITLVFDDFVTGAHVKPDTDETKTAHLAANGWRVDDSPPTNLEPLPKDASKSDDDANAACLDFALVRLASSPGRKRGYFDLRAGSTIVVTEVSALASVGYPIDTIKASPQILALDGAPKITMESEGTRVRYETNMRSRSSGSPVCTSDWKVMALHREEKCYNQGIPISVIVARPKVRGALPKTTTDPRTYPTGTTSASPSTSPVGATPTRPSTYPTETTAVPTPVGELERMHPTFSTWLKVHLGLRGVLSFFPRQRFLAGSG